MNVDIANMINDLVHKTDWIEHIITFLSVFLGAYFAYKFANHQEYQKDKKQRIENYNILWNKVALSLNNLFTYKETYLDRIKQAFEEDDFEEALQTSYVPDCDFSFDDKHHFLNSYNRCFLTELYFLSKLSNAGIEEIKCYYQNVFDVLYDLTNKQRTFLKEYEILKSRFMSFYKEFEHLCVRAYYIDKEFVKGFEKYFNSYNYEGSIYNFELEAKITERIKDKEILENIQEREQDFDRYWQLEPNLFCCLCFRVRKIKHYFRNLVKFIQKPKICKNCRCCKIRMQDK